jgi:Flp pilus assembly protein TadD
MFTVWLVQTSVDWMYLIPGSTAMALAAAVALVSRRPAASASLGGRSRIAAIVAAAAIAIAGTVTIAPRVLSLHAQTSAQNALARGDPRAAIADATTALRYDSRSVPALVLRAAGFARLHAFAPSLADLKRAAAVEPRNWVTWALIGDLLTRRGDRPAARSAYVHALALDPLEPDLRSALSTLAAPAAH